MKNVFCFLCAVCLLISCDDGDLTVTDFDFENKQLQWCGDTENQVLYNLNNDQVHEAIAFKFQMATETPRFLTTEEGITTIPLSAENEVIYRVFDSEVGNSYFCNTIPPVSPKVLEEFRSTSGGEMVITTTLNSVEDQDGDGVVSELEGMDAGQDTDADGIQDHLDIDDDGDNILTRVEIEVETGGSGTFPDSDADGTPDYLDADDDNDGIPTRNEDWNQNNNPADDQDEAGLAYYLNPAIIDSIGVTTVRENTISRSFRYIFSAENLTLSNQGGNGEQIRLEDFEFGYFDSPAEQITLQPSDTTSTAQ